MRKLMSRPRLTNEEANEASDSEEVWPEEEPKVATDFRHQLQE